MVPPNSRLKGSLVDHFAANADRYAGPNKHVANVHVVPITHDIRYVADYVFKTVTRRRLPDEDAVLVLPRARSELGPADRSRSETAERVADSLH